MLGFKNLKLAPLEDIYFLPVTSEAGGGRILKTNKLLSTNHPLYITQLHTFNQLYQCLNS